MSDAPQALIVDLVAWVAARPRTYGQVMAAWRTSCPRLPVWEDAVDLGYVRRQHRPGGGTTVAVTPAGLALLADAGRRPTAAAAADRA